MIMSSSDFTCSVESVDAGCVDTDAAEPMRFSPGRTGSIGGWIGGLTGRTGSIGGWMGRIGCMGCMGCMGWMGRIGGLIGVIGGWIG